MTAEGIAAVAERRGANRGRGDAARYRRIFETVRIALWDLDLSPLLARLGADSGARLEARPRALAAAAALVRVRDVNARAIELFEAGSRAELIAARPAFPPEATPALIAALAALREAGAFEAEMPVRTLGGRPLTVLLTLSWEEDGAAVAGMVDVSRQAAERRSTELERDLLAAEVCHRVRNTLATVISIERQSFALASSVEEARRAFSARIGALAQTHGRLAECRWAAVPLRDILAAELAPLRRGGDATLRGPAVRLRPRAALALGLAFHELAANAARHGALSAPGGRVSAEWWADPQDRSLRIRWVETGGPAVAAPARSGFGRLLLEEALASDLGGGVRLVFAGEGLRCDIAIPLDEHVAAA